MSRRAKQKHVDAFDDRWTAVANDPALTTQDAIDVFEEWATIIEHELQRLYGKLEEEEE